MQIIALIGATCVGKTNIGIDIAKKISANIFSLDSLCIYKEINIASAKPSKEMQQEVKHFCIDLIYANESLNAFDISQELLNCIKLSKSENKNVLILGGSSFYLKSILQGLSPNPSAIKDENFSHDLSTHAHSLQDENLDLKFNFLQEIDINYANKINKNDTYRINKALEIIQQSGLIVSEFFSKYPPRSIFDSLSINKNDIKIYNLQLLKEQNDALILKRTKEMIDGGIVKECEFLLKLYGRNIVPFKSIGLKECLMFLDSRINLETLQDLINQNTIKLAKRQRTFNKTQFKDIINVKKDDLRMIFDL